MKLCLFAMWSPTGRLMNFRKTYLRELRRCADYLVVIAAGKLVDEDRKYLQEQQIDLITRENVGLDFGSWHAGLEAVGDLSEFSHVILANDSCVPIREFTTLAKWIDNNEFDYFGITTSRAISLHVQSYFIVLKPNTYTAVKEYFAKNGVMQASKQAIIRRYEIGLSQHMRQRGFSIGALFPYDVSPVPINPAVVAAPLLMRNGCPIIKRQVVQIFAKYLQPWSDFDVPTLLEGVCPVDAPGFDEDWYLLAHPGVQNLIKLRRFSCGFEHYLRLSKKGKQQARINRERTPMTIHFTN